jgi:sulfur transfer complex TusBCD TusB component (DsrH family)
MGPIKGREFLYQVSKYILNKGCDLVSLLLFLQANENRDNCMLLNDGVMYTVRNNPVVALLGSEFFLGYESSQ